MDGQNAPHRTHRYDAFISYSHTADSTKADRLRRGLQNFARSWRQLRALRIFLDNASLSANPGLWPEIERHLADSGAFILLACPTSAGSAWVQKEINWWRAGLGARRMLIAVTDGELVWDHEAGDFDWERTTCLPRTMAGMFTDEPRWVDLRWMSEQDPGSLRDPRFQHCVADLAAPLHGRPKEDLIGADVTQQRKTRRLVRGTLAVITTLAVAAGLAWVDALHQRDEAQKQARLATSRQLAATALNLKDGNLRLASLLAIEAYRIQESPEAIAALNRLATDSPHLVSMMPSAKNVSALVFSADDTAVAVGDEGGAVAVWRSDGSALRARTSLPGRITAVGFSADGKQLAAGDSQGNVGVYDLTGKALRRLAPLPKAVSSLEFSLGGHLAAVDEDGTVTLYEKARKKIRSKRTGHHSSVVVFQNIESHLLLRDGVGGGALYTVPDLRTVQDSRQFSLPAGQAAPAVSNGGHCFGYLKYGFFTSSRLPKVNGHESLPDTCANFPTLPNEEATMLALTDNGRMAVGTASGITAVDAQTDVQASQVRTLTGVGRPSLLKFSNTGTRLASAHGRTVALWNFDQASRIAHTHGLSLADEQTMLVAPPLATGPGGRVAWSNLMEDEPFDKATKLHLWSPKRPGTLTGGEAPGHYALAFSPDGHMLYAGLAGAVESWQVQDTRLEQRRTVTLAGPVNGYQGIPLDIAPRADGSLVVATADGAVHVADPSAQRTRIAVPRGSEDPQQLLFSSLSADGRTAAMENTQGAVDLYDVGSGRKLQSVRLNGEKVNAFALAAGGSSLFLDGGKTFARWDLDERRFRWQSDEPNGVKVAASEDGRTVITLADNGTLTRWDTDTGDRLGGPDLPIPPHTLSGTGGIGLHTSFMVDGTGTLWTATEGGEVLSWDFSVNSWIESLCRIADRNLTDAEWRRYVGTTPPSRPTCG
ncbi:toll/interleukin-1 receptor domain-containing protein [Streptomyces inhibens]|uniref:toll/interleukin-1 receptor domain-containing protein n=1 Tax=Streptomyces inhibens TaxID=2293571 RepID=UPI001EE750E6|nr:toll/interleukin-1 receptor domain-containing protein [Streptomyces inhibens]UKY50846.1 toll/interleukin-1 receptor domain-containing protein [Streptomyces inhibens]